MTNQYALINTETNKVTCRSTLSAKEARTLNYAFNLNAVSKKYVLTSELLSKFAEYKG